MEQTLKRILAFVFALSLATAATAMERPPSRERQRQYGPPPSAQTQVGPPPSQRWSRGQQLPERYRHDPYEVTDWRRNNLSPPPRGYRWVCPTPRNCYLVAVNTGLIRDTRFADEREASWRQLHSRTYTYHDDLFYRECRERPDPAGILIGGLIGGLLGHAAGGEDHSAATFAGVIIGAVAGAALTRDLDCDDRSFAYQSYYNALNSGRPGSYSWRNPRNNHRGDFRVRSYDYQSGFQCANYSHTIYLDRRRQASGRACRQPDGAWVFLN
jgi:Ni/Co efflux regulator RcnB/surface antigen